MVTMKCEARGAVVPLTAQTQRDLDEEQSQRPQQGEADNRRATRKTAHRQPTGSKSQELNTWHQDVV